MKMTARRLLFAGSIIAIALTNRASYAISLAYDGFNYATGNLAGQNGGTGWTAAWTSSGGTAQVQSPGATYPSLNTVGNKAFISASDQNSRILTAGLQGTGDSTVWASFIGQRTGANNVRFFGLTFYEGGTAAAQERFSIGENSNNNSDLWGARFTNASSGIVNSTVSINTQSLLLVRVNYHAAANDDLYLWVNPNLSAGEPAIGTAAASSIGLWNMVFDRISIRGGTLNGGNIGEAYYDELRIGTTFADVSPGICGLGDTDCNGTVDLNDFEPIRANFRKNVALRTQGDLDLNGVVNFADFREWKGAYVAGGGSMAGVNLDFFAVPEPNTIGIAVLAACVLACGPTRRSLIKPRRVSEFNSL
jgi:hypothetical protein